MTISSLAPTSPTIDRSSTAIGTAVLAKSLNTFEQSGESIVKMMEQSVNPNVGKNFDIKI